MTLENNRINNINSPKFQLLNLNIQSLHKIGKTHLLALEMGKLKSEPDIICLTETWFKPDSAIPLSNYICADSKAREISRGGGSAIYVKPTIKYSRPQIFEAHSVEHHFEISAISIHKLNNIHLKKPWVILSIYRPPTGDFEVMLEKLEAVLSTLHEMNCHYSLSGDFNIDFLDPRRKDVISLCNLLSEFNLRPIFCDEPSRVAKTSATLLDNCFSSSRPIDSVTWDPGLSDHRGQIVSFPIDTESNYINNKRFKRHWSEEACLGLTGQLHYFCSTFDPQLGNVNNTVEHFIRGLYSAIELCCPVRPVKSFSCRRLKNDTLNSLSERKKEYHSLYKNTGLLKYKKLFNKTNKLLKKSLYREKRKNVERMIKNSKNKSFTTWKIIKDQTPSTNNNSLIDAVRCDGVIVSDPAKIANVFNEHLTSLHNTFPSNLAHSMALEMTKKSLKNPPPTFTFSQITLNELYSCVCSLKPNKADTYGCIPPFFFRDYFSIIGEHLLVLINKCIVTGVFPHCLKSANVTPLFKKGSRQDVSNYRPISVLSTVSKLFEKILFKQLLCHFESNNLLYDHQFGFRKGLSTTHALYKLIDKVLTAFEKKLPVMSIHFDLTKAFDLLNHSLLLKKLHLYGLSENALTLIASYLSDRNQRVKIDSVNGPILSSVLPLMTGVPQGSILGPLLFIIFMNDLPFNVKYPILLFADDTSALVEGGDVILKAREVYDQASAWFNANDLTVNQSKTQALMYSAGSCNAPSIDYCILGDSNSIRLENSVEFLGIQIDKGLTWKEHTSKVICKLSRASWALRNLSRISTLQCCLAFYHAHVVSHMRYGLILWGRSTGAEQVFMLQKKLVRIMFNMPWNAHCRPIFIEHRLFTLTSLYILDSLKFAISNGLVSPSDLLPSHNYNSRHRDIKNVKVRLKLSEQDCKFSAIQIINALPWNIKKQLRDGDIRKFFNLLRDLLLNKAFYNLNEFLNSSVE